MHPLEIFPSWSRFMTVQGKVAIFTDLKESGFPQRWCFARPFNTTSNEKLVKAPPPISWQLVLGANTSYDLFTLSGYDYTNPGFSRRCRTCTPSCLAVPCLTRDAFGYFALMLARSCRICRMYNFQDPHPSLSLAIGLEGCSPHLVN